MTIVKDSSGLFASKQRIKFDLQDVKEPQLYRDTFPFDEVCKIDFDSSIILPSPPKDVWITDTTFRDGQQSRPPYTVEQIVQLYKYLHRLSGPHGLIRMTEFFLYSKKDREAVEKCMELDYKYPIISSWIRAVKSDFKLVKEMGIKETGILTSVSDYHIFLKLGKTRKEAMDSYLDIVRTSLEEGIIPRCHLEDITRADIYGFVIPFVQKLMELQEESGIPIKIRACDTMGYGVPYPNAALPRSVAKIIHSLVHDGGVPSEHLEWHGHNDFHKVHANSVTAWLYGCAAVNASLLGIGERTGNSPLEAAIIEYISLYGNDKEIDTTVITEIGEYFEKELEYTIPYNYPFLGRDFNTTRAGIHADGVIKNREIYSIFDTDKLLNRTLDVSVSDKSGVAGVAHWINVYVVKDKKVESINKRHPGVKKIYDWILEEYDNGRTTDVSNEELLEQVKIHIPGLVESDFDRLIDEVKETAFEILEEISNRDELKTMKASIIEKILLNYANKYHFIQFIYVVNTDGQKITKNISQLEDKGKYDQSIDMNTNFSDRTWFLTPLQDGQHHATKFYTSRITGAWCITVSAPIVDLQDNICGIIGMDIRFEEIAKLD